MDLLQYRDSMPKTGKERGFVWHSIWNDRADYVEEPCFILRVYRDYLWSGDRAFLQRMAEPAAMALERVFREKAYEGLLESKEGNQSYDVWKMPGLSAYVNVQWLYALYAMKRIDQTLGTDHRLQGRSIDEALQQAVRSFLNYLWNDDPGYFNCFYRTAGACADSVPESVFTDQLFGRWMLLIEKDLDPLLPREKLLDSVRFAYRNNLLDDPQNDFRGWTNGRLPDGAPCRDDAQYHAQTCWLGAQLALASVLGELGGEAQAADIFCSVEKSLRNDHLAAGEWNRAITREGRSAVLPQEPAKDTPRFPPYPRYKSCWEFLPRLLGLKVSETEMELQPFHSFDFFLRDTLLAGCRLSVTVRRGWQTVYVDGEKREKAVFDRRRSPHEILFL